MKQVRTACDERRYPRILGSYETARPGPTFVVTSGIHGNEHAGVEASLAVCAQLLRDEPPLRGRFLAVACNLNALATGDRFVDEDLNRLWTAEDVAVLRAQPPEADTCERAEQRELLGILDDCLRDEDENFVLDLHTSSANGAPFTCMADTIQNRKVALALPIPVILGLEETIDGAMLDYVYERDRVAIAVEGGRHDAPETRENLESAIWLSLIAAGCLDVDQVPDAALHRRRLEKASRGIPRVLEIRHREVLCQDDVYEMMPGYESFDPVAKNEVLGVKNGRQVRAKQAGMVLLPLYQGQGSDAFFIGRRVRPLWLRVSGWLRRIGFSRVLGLLPGVRRHRERPDVYVVDPRVALFKPVEIFHLLGFRRQRKQGELLLFTRRRDRF